MWCKYREVCDAKLSKRISIKKEIDLDGAMKYTIVREKQKEE